MLHSGGHERMEPDWRELIQQVVDAGTGKGMGLIPSGTWNHVDSQDSLIEVMPT